MAALVAALSDVEVPMPTYQYRCQDCDVLHEVFQSFTDESLTVCPSCDGSLRKVFNSVGVVFKGSGFYRTDARDSSSASTTAASTPKSDAAPAKSDAAPAKADAPAKTASAPASAS